MIVNQSWLVFISIGFFIMMIAFLGGVAFLIYASLEIRRAAASLSEFLKRTDENLKPVMHEAEQTLRSLRDVTDDVGVVTDNIRRLSGALYETADNIRAVSNVVNEFRDGMSLRVSAIKTGVRVALGVLINEIKQRRS